jgi:hypothetical protein
MRVMLASADGEVKRSAIRGRLALVRLHLDFGDAITCACERLTECTHGGKPYLCENRNALCILRSRYARTTRQNCTLEERPSARSFGKYRAQHRDLERLEGSY